MRVRLAGGVVAAADAHAWIPRPSGPARLTGESDSTPGTAVALGPAEATGEEVRHAVTELTRLVKAGGVVAAGAGVDLGAGFRSARLAGARGDQRDAVLAALKVLGLEGAGKLGDRAGFLVALFGPAVTKRVGTAAAQAIGEGRWSAVHLASAASDVLGPEQLERVLALPGGTDLISGGLPSVLAGHLQQVLVAVARPRRLELTIDLWARVSEHHVKLARRERLLATQSRRDRVDDLRKRHKHFEDEQVMWHVRADLDEPAEPSLADAARWTPPAYYWHQLLNRLLRDSLAVTALLRTAVAVSDRGLEDGLAQSKPLLCAAVAELSEEAVKPAMRKVPGLTGLPARPVCHVWDIHRKLHEDGPVDAKLAAYVRARLARARDYALLILEMTGELLDGSLLVPEEVLGDWSASVLRSWRRRVGYTSVRPPSEWGAVSLWRRELPEPRDPLARRVEALEDPVTADVEVAGDLLWYADMVDALAQSYGHDAARLIAEPGASRLEHDPPMGPSEPLTPRLDSIALAVSGAAQLVALGGRPAPGAKTWHGFVDSLRANTEIAEALSGDFSIPAPLAALDGAVVPGTGARFLLARSARTLAEWSSYMGNCIAGPYYIEEAMAGRSSLVALHDKGGRILANVELRRARPVTRGWRVAEIAGRFNDTADETLEKRFRRWVSAIPGPEGADETGPAASDETWPDRPARRRVTPRLLQDAGPALTKLVEQAWADQVTGSALGTLATLAETAPDAALIRLRRLRSGQLTNACRSALDNGGLDLVGLWDVTGFRPLETAVEGLDPALRDRFEQLALLLDDGPLPASLRKFVKQPAVAPAYSMTLVTHRIRTAIGQLAYDGDPVIADALTRRTTTPLLCALVVAVTCGGPAIDLTPVAPPRTITVPGFPASRLDDKNGPWHRALPAAREMGADTAVFWEQIAEHGLRIPTAWLGAGGWTALWSRAHNHPASPATRKP